MKRLLAMAMLACCAVAVGEDSQRLVAKQMEPGLKKPALTPEVKRLMWQGEVHERYMNREWFVELADKFAETGLRPTFKPVHGICVNFVIASNEEELQQAINRKVLASNVLGVIHKEIRKRGKKFLAVTMWLDEDVVDWPFDGGNWSTTGRRRIDSR